MGKEIRVDPSTLVDLATASLAAADRAGARYRAGFRHLPVPSSALGDLPAAAGVAHTADGLLADAHDAVSSLAAALEVDADALLRTAFAYRAADVAADSRLGGSRGPGR
ncbi:hypothetical protein ACFFX1_28705 [Dactylosporangium sucinum]|uniref:Uncharacterized protein n=1 Tax=Dactylosporangium sucinum TaxID=1424081 RepID=A0A917UAA5_9ACTN|nr:hypothetical protein [Dactylosporangium sucinum]GGM70752.1 hypothetical protein GCM10007977_085760 [Dactylosporangium sucinum]